MSQLSANADLCTDGNRIADLSLQAPARELRILKISRNSLTRLDLAYMPNLRTVRFLRCSSALDSAVADMAVANRSSRMEIV